MTVAADLSYQGDLKLEIATKATLNFGSRFKTRGMSVFRKHLTAQANFYKTEEVSLLLLVAFKSLEGRINFTLKPPPSNRFWYCFETMPQVLIFYNYVLSTLTNVVD